MSPANNLIREYMNILNESFLTDKEDIHAFCRNYYLEDYRIRSDGTVDVDTDAVFDHLAITKLPVKFGKVTGSFVIRGGNTAKLTTLEGCPEFVGIEFDCSNNNLTSLKGMPKFIGTDFWSVPDKLKPTAYIELLGSEIDGRIYTGDQHVADLLNSEPRKTSRDKLRIIQLLRQMENSTNGQ